MDFEAFGLLFGDLIDDVLPSVEFLSGLKFLVQSFDLLSGFLTEDGLYL